MSSFAECEALGEQSRWLYMCAAVKAVCNSSGLGHMVFDTAGPLLGAVPSFSGWQGVDYGNLPERDMSLAV